MRGGREEGERRKEGRGGREGGRGEEGKGRREVTDYSTVYLQREWLGVDIKRNRIAGTVLTYFFFFFFL